MMELNQAKVPIPSSHLPPASSLTADTLPAALSTLFNPSPALESYIVPYLLPHTPFPSYDELVALVRPKLRALASSSSDRDISLLHDILAAHPRLGAKKVEGGLSHGEQAGLRAGLGEDTEMEELERLNEEYERLYEGLRCV